MQFSKKDTFYQSHRNYVVIEKNFKIDWKNGLLARISQNYFEHAKLYDHVDQSIYYIQPSFAKYCHQLIIWSGIKSKKLSINFFFVCEKHWNLNELLYIPAQVYSNVQTVFSFYVLKCIVIYTSSVTIIKYIPFLLDRSTSCLMHRLDLQKFC